MRSSKLIQDRILGDLVVSLRERKNDDDYSYSRIHKRPAPALSPPNYSTGLVTSLSPNEALLLPYEASSSLVYPCASRVNRNVCSFYPPLPTLSKELYKLKPLPLSSIHSLLINGILSTDQFRLNLIRISVEIEIGSLPWRKPYRCPNGRGRYPTGAKAGARDRMYAAQGAALGGDCTCHCGPGACGSFEFLSSCR